MNYLLVKEEQLAGKDYDYRYAERIPDGRIILPLSALKVLSGFAPEVLSDEELKALIKEQQESGIYDAQADGNPEGQPASDGEEHPDSGTEEVDNEAEEGGTV
ncbi:hypothetical protein EV202_12755 [Bacteroides heparinolyticus]|uniref:Uncharacterized protein n=1 Tax=Prevotella heparinolytica TaxID=28113 RepID=A0A4V2SE94_9BACE|nr:hypothetical protein [Bacteroides heparinolyticus]TCO88172.1 hypothetical protein EV202_12755 [Bacteroides heparinolyticus]